MKINFNLDDDLLLNDTLKLYNMVMVGRFFDKGRKYYSRVFLHECLYKLSSYKCLNWIGLMCQKN